MNPYGKEIATLLGLAAANPAAALGTGEWLNGSGCFASENPATGQPLGTARCALKRHGLATQTLGFFGGQDQRLIGTADFAAGIV